jgi:hypothetical protein
MNHAPFRRRLYPGLRDLPLARVRVYRPETSIAEKTDAMVRLALANSRMKELLRYPTDPHLENVGLFVTVSIG